MADEFRCPKCGLNFNKDDAFHPDRGLYDFQKEMVLELDAMGKKIATIANELGYDKGRVRNFLVWRKAEIKKSMPIEPVEESVAVDGPLSEEDIPSDLHLSNIEIIEKYQEIIPIGRLRKIIWQLRRSKR